ARALLIWNTASTLPTRSTTAMVARAPRACASPTAWAITRCTSVSERKFARERERQSGAQGGLRLPDPVQPRAAAAARPRAAARRLLPGTARLRDRTGLRARVPRVA